MRWSVLLGSLVVTSVLAVGGPSRKFPNIPGDYLREAKHVPSFWKSTLEEVNRFLEQGVRSGTLITVGTTAGGRRIRATVYGKPRGEKGTTTFSGALGFGDVRAYLGPDAEKRVYMGMAGVHGGEFEGIVGMLNLLAVLETNKDLRGKAWPEISAAAKFLDRIIIVPVVNADGRARVPLRMGLHRGSDETIPEYFNTGGWPDGKLIGWPGVKQFIPLAFSRTQFPGGYPNDNGVNIQHDDFFGRRQPETQALLDLTARERPDLILNMHTGAVFPLMHRPFAEPAMTPVFEELFRRVQTGLAQGGLQETADPRREADPSRVADRSPYNLDSALNLHSGALSVVIESPSHAASTAKRDGKPHFFSADELLDAQLICHQEAMKFLVATGGRSRWTPSKQPR
jgi:hypothetical protein